MSEPTTPKDTPVTPKDPVKQEITLKQLIDLAALKIKKIRNFQLGGEEVEDKETGGVKSEPRFIGKPGHNPYLYLAQTVAPIEAKISDESITADELNAFLKLPDNVTPDGKVIKPVNVMLRDHLRNLSVPTRNK